LIRYTKTDLASYLHSECTERTVELRCVPRGIISSGDYDHGYRVVGHLQQGKDLLLFQFNPFDEYQLPMVLSLLNTSSETGQPIIFRGAGHYDGAGRFGFRGALLYEFDVHSIQYRREFYKLSESNFLTDYVCPPYEEDPCAQET
jgi:hypothetical protein